MAQRMVGDMRREGAPREVAPTDRRRTLWSGVMIGIGLAGTLDEVVLHQLLHWHHLYDRSTQAVGLVSDGIFHIVSTALLVWGVMRVWDDRTRPYAGWVRRLVAGICLGAGGFNLYDATIQHKLLRLHQVRPEASNWLPYDIAFIGGAALVLLVGLVLLRGTAAPASGHGDA